MPESAKIHKSAFDKAQPCEIDYCLKTLCIVGERTTMGVVFRGHHSRKECALKLPVIVEQEFPHLLSEGGGLVVVRGELEAVGLVPISLQDILIRYGDDLHGAVRRLSEKDASKTIKVLAARVEIAATIMERGISPRPKEFAVLGMWIFWRDQRSWISQAPKRSGMPRQSAKQLCSAHRQSFCLGGIPGYNIQAEVIDHWGEVDHFEIKTVQAFRAFVQTVRRLMGIN